ncbi:hypothetical protein [Sphaerotilus uruguayifluvii]|nr:hypothetical protein [Leptothrix sp. C29]
MTAATERRVSSIVLRTLLSASSPPAMATASTLIDDPELADATAYWLTQGGDTRLQLDVQGTNLYGCPPRPDPGLIALGSSTASVVSARGFEAASRLMLRLGADPGCWPGEVDRVRAELLALTGADQVTGTQVVLAASGTDLHLIATQILSPADGEPGAARPLQALMADPSETGSGVPKALAARHFNTVTAQGAQVAPGLSLPGLEMAPARTVALREPDGRPRPVEAIDAEFAAEAERIVRAGGRCLLVMVDVSKTGLVAPSPACALRLRHRWGEQVEVLVDACQFRLAPESVAAFLRQDFLVALTGSKFVGGPAFSGALLLPPAAAARVRRRPLHRLRSYSARGDWPRSWPGARELPGSPNPGLLLRWEAALAELRRLREVPAAAVQDFLREWGAAASARLTDDPVFEPLPVTPLAQSRDWRVASAGPACWDRLPTILPFLPRRREGRTWRPLRPEETAWLHRQMREAQAGDGVPLLAQLRFQIGQPVVCGVRDGQALTALRLCVGARDISAATSGARGPAEALTQARLALDKLAWLIGRI